MRLAVLVLLVLMAISSNLSSQTYSNEVSIGLGASFPREKDPLNVTGEAGVPTSFTGNLGYRKSIADLATIGVRGIGTISTLKDYVIAVGSSSPRNTEFRLSTLNVALEALLLLSDEGNTKPFATIMGIYSMGVLSSKDMPNLNYSGVCFGASLGIRFPISRTMGISVEGIGTFGSAKWRDLPFSNSSGAEYNPSSIILLTNVWFMVK